MERQNLDKLFRVFPELIHQVALDVTVVVCAGDSDRSDTLRITQFVAPRQVYHLLVFDKHRNTKTGYYPSCTQLSPKLYTKLYTISLESLMIKSL